MCWPPQEVDAWVSKWVDFIEKNAENGTIFHRSPAYYAATGLGGAYLVGLDRVRLVKAIEKALQLHGDEFEFVYPHECLNYPREKVKAEVDRLIEAAR